MLKRVIALCQDTLVPIWDRFQGNEGIQKDGGGDPKRRRIQEEELTVVPNSPPAVVPTSPTVSELGYDYQGTPLSWNLPHNGDVLNGDVLGDVLLEEEEELEIPGAQAPIMPYMTPSGQINQADEERAKEAIQEIENKSKNKGYFEAIQNIDAATQRLIIIYETNSVSEETRLKAQDLFSVLILHKADQGNKITLQEMNFLDSHTQLDIRRAVT